MASIYKEIVVDVPSAQAWDAMRDVVALPTRLATGFVTECHMDGDARIVKFANGMQAREIIVDINDADRRLVWSVVGGRMTHHNASTQIFDEGAGRCRIVWVADLLPHALAPAIAGMIEQGMAAMKKTLESAPQP
jgi:carbon monoxide dehydrogenase subunit G